MSGKLSDRFAKLTKNVSVVKSKPAPTKVVNTKRGNIAKKPQASTISKLASKTQSGGKGKKVVKATAGM